MSDDEVVQNPNPLVYLACQREARALMAKYDWALLREDELAALALQTTSPESVPSNLTTLLTQQYIITLYEACRQTKDPARRERGYTEVFHFLYRAAYKRWPDLAEVVAQRGMVLVFQQLDRCYRPDTFLTFALNKLRQACTDELRFRGRDESLDDLLDRLDPPDPGNDLGGVDQEERLRVLIEGIRRLPDKRQQKVILLKFFGGVSGKAIAARLNLDENLVRQLNFRAIQQLRKDEKLQDYVWDG